MLYLWMPEAKENWRWSTGGDWLEALSFEQLVDDISPYRDQETTVFFSSLHVQILQQAMSKVHVKKLGQEGIRYLLEEYTAFPIDQFHVVHQFESIGRISIAGVSKSTLESWQSSLSLLPIKLVALLPDFLILPAPFENQVNIVHLYGKTLVRENLYSGTWVDDLALYLEFQNHQNVYQYAHLNQQEMEVLQRSVSSERYTAFDFSFEGIIKPERHPFNMLPKAKKEVTLSGYWKGCLALILLLVLVQFVTDAWRWVVFKKNANQAAVAVVEQYQAWFGKSGRVTEQNVQSLFESQLRLNQQSDMDALNLLSRIGPVLAQRQIVAQQINYEAGNMLLSLKANSATDLQNLTQQLNQQGFKANLDEVKANGAGAIGMVKLQK